MLESVKEYPRILEELVQKQNKALYDNDNKETGKALHLAAERGHHETILVILNYLQKNLPEKSFKDLVLRHELIVTAMKMAYNRN